MLIASISEAKNRLSALLDRVRAGESVLIVDRGIPVARLEPAVSADEEPDGRLARLERAGLVRVAKAPTARSITRSKPPRPKKAGAALAALLAERAEAR
jgi:prevent-host-death family protein